LDNQYLEKQVDEALQPKEGEDALDEEARLYHARKIRFQILTRLFYAPHLVPQHPVP
jgi:hypothetical protein